MHKIGWQTVFFGVGAVLVQIQSAQALTKAEVSKVAQGVTVMIQNAQNPQDTGSGVIIKREGETYTVLTSRHVVERSPSYTLITPDEKQHSMLQGSIQAFLEVDLALVKFKSSEPYSVVKIGDSAQSPLGTASFVAGFPGMTAVRSEPTFYFTSGEIAANASRPLKDGYAIAYNNPTLPGMSGGPVLNAEGELIGIHGRAEAAERLQNSQISNDIYVLKTEFNYAIPINTFLRLAPRIDNTIAFRTPSPSIPSGPKADDFFLQAEEKLKEGNINGSFADLNQAIRLNPKFAAAYLGRGFVRKGLGDKQGEIADYNEAIRLDPKLGNAYSNRGVVRSELGDKQGAILDLDQAIRLDPKFPPAYFNRGAIRNELGDKQGAIADFDQAIRLDPQLTRAYAGRGQARNELGDKQGAIADFDQAIRLDPKFALAYNGRGLVRKSLGDKQGAIADFDQAIRLDPNFAPAYANRGAFRNESGDKQGAISDLDQTIRLDPKLAIAYYSRGVIRSNLGDKQGAITDYDQAIRLNPNDALTYNSRGLARSTLGDKQGAIVDYDQAIRLDPKLATAYYNRGLVRSKLGDKQGAIADLTVAAALYKAKGEEKKYQMALQSLQNIISR